MDVAGFGRGAFLAALERPRFHDGRRLHIGTILSAKEWFRYETRLQRCADTTPEEREALIREVTDAMFPPPPRWMFWRSSVSSALLALPHGLQLEAFMGFVAAQAAIQRSTTSGLMNQKTNGTPSPA